MGFPERLKHYRLIKGYTQKDLSELIHVKSATISSWEVGRNYPQAPKLRALAKALGVEVRELTGGLSDNAASEATMKTTQQSLSQTNDNEAKKHQLQLDNDVDKALQAVISYDGRPVTEHDRRVLSDIIKAYLNDRKWDDDNCSTRTRKAQYHRRWRWYWTWRVLFTDHAPNRC